MPLLVQHKGFDLPLGSATEWTGGEAYDHDGNRAVTTRSAPLPGLTGEAPTLLSQYLTASNRIGSFSYDGRGNITAVPGRPTITYDAENHQISSVNVNGSSSYAYDGDGRRVTKTVGSVTTTFVYDAMGQLAAEYGGTATPVGRQYVTVDHLGSTRVVTGTSGTTTYDYLPFGEELNVACLNAADGVKFAANFRDQESCLDFAEARMMSSAQGRFTGVDSHPGVPGIPQSWNKYAYVFNNPLKLVDPDGRFPTPAHTAWGASALTGLGFRNPQGLSRVVNEHADALLFANRIHSMSGEGSYEGARWGLLQIATNGQDPVKAGVALVMGFHLVEDYQSHGGMSGFFALFQHAGRYHGLSGGEWDADPTSAAGKEAEAQTKRFADDFMSMLVLKLGDKGAQTFLNRMRTATTSVTGIDKAIQGIRNDLAKPTKENRQIGRPYSYEDDAKRQCELGNPAACGIP